VVPGELVEDEDRGQLNEFVERRPQRVHVVQNAAGDDRVERARIVELLEGHAPVERAVGSVGVDRNDVEAGDSKCGSYTSFPSAANLEDPTWRLRQL
jgi:hypothetical protein